ncbi:MAG TPA: glycosyltransferase family 2 protein [Terriglobia bacterium]|nr:glycosyltransferase family 2 protein [Terriglobia bacterium]
MDLSIIIVNWNSAGFTIPCISSIYTQTHGLDFEVLVVDNASTDDSCRAIQERWPSVKLITSPQNLGFARANNLGFQNSSGRILLFLNPDTELRGPAINLMQECFVSSADIGVLGCRLLNSDLSVQTSCIQPFPTILNQIADAEPLRRLTPRLKLWGMRPLFESDPGRPVEVEAVSGACLMIKREVFEQVGLFSTDYFMYNEDLDLCYQVKKAGKRVCYLGAATIVHHGGQSSRQRGGEAFVGPLMKETLWRFLEKTRGPFYAALYRLAMFVISLLRVALLAILIPIPSARLDKDSHRHSLAKWHKVLRWSVGLEAWTGHMGKPVASQRIRLSRA